MTREEEYEAFRAALQAVGWKTYQDGLARDGNLPFYACRKPKHPIFDCCLNDKAPLFWVKFHHFYPGLYNNWNIPDSKSGEIVIEGQLPNGKWVRLNTSCDWEECLDETAVSEIESMLCAAYNSAYRDVMGKSA